MLDMVDLLQVKPLMAVPVVDMAISHEVDQVVTAGHLMLNDRILGQHLTSFRLEVAFPSLLLCQHQCLFPLVVRMVSSHAGEASLHHCTYM